MSDEFASGVDGLRANCDSVCATPAIVVGAIVARFGRSDARCTTDSEHDKHTE